MKLEGEAVERGFVERRGSGERGGGSVGLSQLCSGSNFPSPTPLAARRQRRWTFGAAAAGRGMRAVNVTLKIRTGGGQVRAASHQPPTLELLFVDPAGAASGVWSHPVPFQGVAPRLLLLLSSCNPLLSLTHTHTITQSRLGYGANLAFSLSFLPLYSVRSLRLRHLTELVRTLFFLTYLLLTTTLFIYFYFM